eukprot:2812579-Prymnesium_polylepis.1
MYAPQRPALLHGQEWWAMVMALVAWCVRGALVCAWRAGVCVARWCVCGAGALAHTPVPNIATP